MQPALTKKQGPGLPVALTRAPTVNSQSDWGCGVPAVTPVWPRLQRLLLLQQHSFQENFWQQCEKHVTSELKVSDLTSSTALLGEVKATGICNQELH